MKVEGKQYRTIWQSSEDSEIVQIIDQRYLPHEFVIINLKSVDDVYRSIKDMAVRGAPLIGGTAAWGMYIAIIEASKRDLGMSFILKSGEKLLSARPTAVNLEWAIDRMISTIDKSQNYQTMITNAQKEAEKICDDDVDNSINIGLNGLDILKKISKAKNGDTVNILTHCNAGWLATIDRGTATAPMYAARDAGIDIHIWVDETRPRNQGASLTAWELMQEGIKHTVIVDNAGGHLMQHNKVDICIVGSDRTTRAGDVCNKIGTYLKALAAFDNQIPFYVALPDSTIDWSIKDGIRDIPIEERDSEEVSHISGVSNNKTHRVRITPDQTPSMNYAFDVTPSKYITGLIMPRGVCNAEEPDIIRLYPEHK
jgi:methylthioribose-1-phosphate isomerase